MVYPGTHDNDTLRSWLRTAPKASLKRAKTYLGLNQEEGYAEGMLRGVLSCPSKLAIISMADWLGLDKEGRINTPSTLGDNWTWRAQPGVFTAALAKSIRAKCALYGRV